MTVRGIVGLVAFAVVAAGLYVVRENTMAREDVSADLNRHLVVEFRVDAQLLPSHELPAIASAVFNACRLEAEAGLSAPVTQLSEHRFRAVLTPAPNDTDRAQLSGCLSDLTFAHTRSGDVEMREVPQNET